MSVHHNFKWVCIIADTFICTYASNAPYTDTPLRHDIHFQRLMFTVIRPISNSWHDTDLLQLSWNHARLTWHYQWLFLKWQVRLSITYGRTLKLWFRGDRVSTPTDRYSQKCDYGWIRDLRMVVTPSLMSFSASTSNAVITWSRTHGWMPL